MVTDVKKMILSFGIIVFTLIGVLFGMNITGFIFGTLGVAQADSLLNTNIGVSNETDAWLNTSDEADAYILNATQVNGFISIVSIQSIANYSDGDGIILTAANYTFNATSGAITNLSSEDWNNVTLFYTYLRKGDAKLIAEGVTNNSLQGLDVYAQQANTQFSTVSVAITLIILLAVFGLFWAFFITAQGKPKKKSSGNFT